MEWERLGGGMIEQEGGEVESGMMGRRRARRRGGRGKRSRVKVYQVCIKAVSWSGKGRG